MSVSTPSVQPSMTIVYPAPQGQPALTSEETASSLLAPPPQARRRAAQAQSVKLPIESSDPSGWGVQRLPVKRKLSGEDDAAIAALVALGGATAVAATALAFSNSGKKKSRADSADAGRDSVTSRANSDDAVVRTSGDLYHGKQGAEDNCGLHASNAALRGRGIDPEQQARFRAFVAARGSESSSIEPFDLMRWHNESVAEIRNNQTATSGDISPVHEVTPVTLAVETYVDGSGRVAVRSPDGSRLSLQDHIAGVMQHKMRLPEHFDHVMVPTTLLHESDLHRSPYTHWVTLAWTHQNGGGWHEIDSLNHVNMPRRLGPGAQATVHDAAAVVAAHVERHLGVGGPDGQHMPGRYCLNLLHPIIEPIR